MINLLTILLAVFTHLLTRKPSPTILRLAGTRGKVYRIILVAIAHSLATAGFLFFWLQFTEVRSSRAQESLVFWVMLVQDLVRYDLLPAHLVPLATSLLTLLATGGAGPSDNGPESLAVKLSLFPPVL